jgi:hypothetical protein
MSSYLEREAGRNPVSEKYFSIHSRFVLRNNSLGTNSSDKGQDNLRHDIRDFVRCGSALDPEVRSSTQIVYGGG